MLHVCEYLSPFMRAEVPLSVCLSALTEFTNFPLEVRFL